MRFALDCVFAKKRDRIFAVIWIALFLLFLLGFGFAWFNEWHYRTFVYWLAFLLLFVGPTGFLYFRAGRYDDEHEGGNRHIAVAAFSSIFGIALFLAMSGLLPVQEATSADGYIEITWAGEGFLVESHKTYAKSELLFFMKDVELEDTNHRDFKINPFFFLP